MTYFAFPNLQLHPKRHGDQALDASYFSGVFLLFPHIKRKVLNLAYDAELYSFVKKLIRTDTGSVDCQQRGRTCTV